MFAADTLPINNTDALPRPAFGVAVSRAGAFWQGLPLAYGFYFYPWQTTKPGAEP